MAVKINQHLIEKHAHSILIPSSTFCEAGLAAASFLTSCLFYLILAFLKLGFYKEMYLN